MGLPRDAGGTADDRRGLGAGGGLGGGLGRGGMLIPPEFYWKGEPARADDAHSLWGAGGAAAEPVERVTLALGQGLGMILGELEQTSDRSG